MNSLTLSLVSFTSLLQSQNMENICWFTFNFRLSIVWISVLLRVFLRVLIYAGACARVCMLMEVQDIVYFPVSLLALNVEMGLLIFPTSLTAQFATVIPWSCLCPTGIIDRLSYPPGFFIGTGTRTLVLTLEHQVLYLLGHFLHPSTDTFSSILNLNMSEQNKLL